MSLQLVIPWRVALQQSPPPLHQPAATLQQWRGALQPAIRRYLFTTLTRGLTLGAHPTLSLSLSLCLSFFSQLQRAFSALESAYAQQDSQMQYLNIDPHFDELRTDARFASLSQRVGLPA